MGRVNDKPVSAQNPVPQTMVVKNLITGNYDEVDSATPLQVVLSTAVPVGGSTLIQIDDGAGNPITISRSAVDPGAMKVEIINQKSSSIIQLDDGAGNPVLISHLAGILNTNATITNFPAVQATTETNPLTNIAVNNFPAVQAVSQVDNNRKTNFDNGAGIDVPAKHIGGVQEVLNRLEDPITTLPTTIKNVNGKQRVSSTAYEIEVAQGNIPNHTNFSIHGSSINIPIIDTFATNLLLPINPTIDFPAPVSIVSTSAIDTGPAVGFALVAPILPAINYPMGSTIFNIAGGAGAILAGDLITLGADINIYTVASYIPNILPLVGGVLTLLTPTLIAHVAGDIMTLTPALPNLGVYSIDVYGLDALGNFYEENVVMSGILPVLTVGSFSCVNYIIAKTANKLALGSAGAITCTTTIPIVIPPAVAPPVIPAIIQQIDILSFRSQSLYFKMPNDKKGFISNIDLATDNKILAVTAKTTLDEFSKTVGNIFTNKKHIWGDRGTTTYEFTFPLYMPPGCEFAIHWFDARGNGGLIANVSAEIFMENV